MFLILHDYKNIFLHLILTDSNGSLKQIWAILTRFHRKIKIKVDFENFFFKKNATGPSASGLPGLFWNIFDGRIKHMTPD